jgi:hypothetical protein
MINGAYTEAWLRNFADRIAALAVQEVEWERSLAERMRDIWRDNAMHEKRHAERAKAQLATAKREELDETCKRALAGDSEAFSTLCARVLAIVERNAIHPATPSGETKCADVAGCDGKCCATPSPEAREESFENIARRYVPDNNGEQGCGDGLALLSLNDRVALIRAGAALGFTAPTDDGAEVVLMVEQEIDSCVRITPADAKRIVAMGLKGGMNALAQEAPDAAE